MITGYNTDVEYAGRVYHVQTEDKGRLNPVVESLVYSGGEIVGMRRVSYLELANSSDFSETGVIELMEAQHQRLVRDIRNGNLDPGGPKPFGYELISNRSLNEVVLDYLSTQVGLDRLRLEVEAPELFVSGKTTQLKLRVLAEPSERPVTGARIEVWLEALDGTRHDLHAGLSDTDGRTSVPVDLPQDVASRLVCVARAGDHETRASRPVGRPASTPGG